MWCRRICRVPINSTTRTSTSTARTAARAASPTTSCARWRRARHTTSRSRCPRITRAAPTGTIRITTARPMCRWRAAWRAPPPPHATSPRRPRAAPGARARVVVAGGPLPMKVPAGLPKPPLGTIRDSEITGRRTLVLGATAPENDAAGHWQEFTFTVDGKIFDPSRIDQRVKLGAVEEWTIRNTHDHDDHMFHIHTNPFQVMSIGGVPQADRTWRDTVVVPRPAKGGNTVIRTRFLDYTGVFMMHCHIMNHEELGMMQAVEVYKD